MIRLATPEDLKEQKERQILEEEKQEQTIVKWLRHNQDILSQKISGILEGVSYTDGDYSFIIPTEIKASSELGKNMLFLGEEHHHYYSSLLSNSLGGRINKQNLNGADCRFVRSTGRVDLLPQTEELICIQINKRGNS